MFRHILRFSFVLLVMLSGRVMASPEAPVLIGLDGAYGLANSTSAQSIEKGIRIAIEEINASGGVLNGRKLKLVTRDNRSMPARGIQNINDFAAMPDLVAVVSGRFTPVVIETLESLHRNELINLAAWSAGDPVVHHGRSPNYVFRLSLRDSLAMPKMIGFAAERGATRIGLLLTNTSWGRSNEAAAGRYLRTTSSIRSVGTAWYNWRDQSLIAQYQRLKSLGAEAIILVSSDDEGATLVREVAELPKAERMPIISHWGVTGGDFAKQAGVALHEIDFSVIQTVSFFDFTKAKTAKFLETANRLFGISRIEQIEAPVGMAHAYDLTYILSKAINLAGSTDRPAIRDALEQVRDYDGLIKHYSRPFTPDRHEALGSEELLIARYDRKGVLIPLE